MMITPDSMVHNFWGQRVLEFRATLGIAQALPYLHAFVPEFDSNEQV